MNEIKKTRSLLEKAQREERKASDEMFNKEQQANEQKTQLDTIIEYRDECLEGLKTAKEARLSVVQVRECQLLVQYLDSVVETRQFKADASQEKYDESRKDWEKKNEHYKKIKETLLKLEANDSLQQQSDDINDTGDKKSGLYYRT